MTAEPSTNAVIRAILDAASTYNPRPGEIIPTLGVQMKVGTSFRAEELNAAFDEMVRRGWIESKVDRFFRLTELGFEEM